MPNRRKKSKAALSSFRSVKPYVVIVAIGIIVRLIYNSSLADSVFFDNHILDTMVLHKWALSIIYGQTAQFPFLRAPLYPYLLAAAYAVLGVSQWSIVVVQQLFGLVTAVVVYRFARDLFDEPTALIAGIIAAIYPTLLFFEGTVLITTTSVFLYTLAFRIGFRALSDGSVRKYMMAGILFGLAAITRPTILPLVVVFPIALIWIVKRKQIGNLWKQLLVFIATVACVILPVTIANVVGGGEFVLISSQGGVNFYIGNSEKADGISVTAPGPITRGGPYEDNIWTSSVDEAEKRVGHELSQSEVSSYWLNEAVDQIAADPVREIKLLAKKFYYFWHGQEIFNNMSPYYAAEYSTLMALILWHKVLNFPSGLLIPLALVGMILGFRDNRKTLIPTLFALIYSLVITLFFVCSRFRQPILPLLIIFAAFGAMKLYQLYRAHKKSFGGWLGAFVGLVIILNLGGDIESTQNKSQFESFIGNAYLGRNEARKAIEHLERAKELSPGNLDVYVRLGNAYFSIGDYVTAKRTYRKGIALFDKNSDMLFGLANTYQAAEQPDSAKLWYTITTQQVPDFPIAYDRLGYLYVSEGNIDSALVCYRKLLELLPNKTELRDYVKQLEDYKPSVDTSEAP